MGAVDTIAARELQAWVSSRGGTRAAAAALGVGHTTLSRWCTGQRLPDAAPDPDLGGQSRRAWLEQQTGIAAAGWELMAAPRAGEGAPTRQEPPGVVQTPPLAGPSATGQPGPSAPVQEDPPEESIEALKARLTQIPGQLREIRVKVAGGDLATTAAEGLRRLLEAEARAARLAVDAAGVATVEEVQALRELLREVTSGCENCRERAAARLRGMAG